MIHFPEQVLEIRQQGTSYKSWEGTPRRENIFKWLSTILWWEVDCISNTGVCSPLHSPHRQAPPCHRNSPMTPRSVITLSARNCGGEHWSVTSGQSCPHRQCWKIALWFMSAAFACRTGSCLQLYSVDLTLAWSFYSQSLISTLDAPGWCVWYCGFSADNSSGTCLILHFRETWEHFFRPSCLKLPPPAHRTIASRGCRSLPLCTFARSHRDATDLNTEVWLHFRILPFVLLFWHSSPWGGGDVCN